MNEELRKRDLLWCQALVATLSTGEVAKVTAEFNRIRPDKAVEQSFAADSDPVPGTLDYWASVTSKDAGL